MFVSIRTKLVILLILANTLMIGAMLYMNAASFNRGFSQYVAQQETRRLEPLLMSIAEQYERQGDWRWLNWKSPIWLNTLRQSMDPRSLKEIGHAPSGMPSRGFFERLTIKDATTDAILLGRKNSRRELTWLPISVAEHSEPVAYLGFEPNSRLDAEFDAVFSKRLTQQLVYIGLIALLIAGALAIPFSGWLVRPIRRLNAAMSQMRDGDLSATVSVDRHDELGDLAKDFNRLSEVLRQNQEDRQTWVSDIAHELRTPVAVLQADIEAAQDGIRQVNDDWLRSLHSHAERLTRLVNDLHQLSQSDAGTLSYRFETTDLCEVLDDALSQFEASFKQAHLSYEWQCPKHSMFIRADINRLAQLFSNLAQNSLRYTDGSEAQPGRIRIAVTQHNSSVELCWEDSSPGVGDKDLPLLFDRLYRVDDSRSRSSGGSGLGLAIVKNIIEAHDATFSAHQSDLGGVQIRVRFPFVKDV